MARIAVGGFQHETNTFAPVKATLETFEQSDGWPGLTRGMALFDVFTGVNIALAGFLDQIDGRAHELLPLLWASATPSAQVTQHAYEIIMGVMLEGLRAVAPVDAVFLDLHGAMVSEHLDDGEGDILARVRETIGPGALLVASIDLHANVSAQMVARADAMIGYRTYPHIDMADTGARCAVLLEELLSGRPRLQHVFRQIPFMIPLTAQCTDLEPAASLMNQVAGAENRAVRTVSFALGFPPADIRDCGPSLFAYGDDQPRLAETIDKLHDAVVAAESQFDTTFYDIDEAIEKAADCDRAGPVILADTQDNPGAGGNADTVALLRGLLRHDVEGSAMGIFYDPEVVAKAQAAGTGSAIDVALGAKSGFPGETPLVHRFVVEQIGDGCFTAPGPYFGGALMELGPMARLRAGNVQVVLASRKEQAADRAMFEHVGLDPSRQRILCLKSSVHFRADLAPLASDILVVVAPGPNVADPARLRYHKLRSSIRRGSALRR